MIVDNKKQQQDNLANLEASLAPAEAEFGAVAKADQYLSLSSSLMSSMSSNVCKREWCRKCGTGGWATSVGFMVGDNKTTRQQQDKTW